MKTLFCIFLSVSCSFPALAQPKKMKQEVLLRIAEKEYNPVFSAIAARLKTGIKINYAYRQLDTLLSKEYGDMFWMYGCAGLYFSVKKILPASYKKKIKECWKKFTPYRGDTENHWLMYYASLFLMSQEFKQPASEWFLGKSSKAIHTESKEYLDFWINRSVKFGQIEFDSPRYLYFFITPLLLLSEYAKEPEMKKKSRMMLEFLLAGYAANYLNGNYAGAHSRIGYDEAFDTRNTETASYGEYFFEDSVIHLLPDLAFAALSSFTIPSIINEIAHTRNEPYGEHEIKRSRNALRYTSQLNIPVYKYTFMTNAFSLGSMQGGIVQPIQQRSWSLTINSPHANNIIFGLHPYVSETELGKFFPEEPSFMLEKIEGVKNGYTNENKWVGGSPYETICQFKNELLALYEGIPADIKYQHVDIFLPGWGKILREDQSGIRIQYDSCFVLIVPRSRYSLIPDGENYRLRLGLDTGKTGYFISCNQNDDFNEFDSDGAFCAKDDIPPGIRQDEWLFYSKFLESKLGSGILKMKSGANERILDFTTNTIR